MPIKDSDSESSIVSSESYNTLPISPSLLYDQRDFIEKIRSKQRRNAVTLSSLQRGSGLAECHDVHVKYRKHNNKSQRSRRSPKVSLVERTSMDI